MDDLVYYNRLYDLYGELLTSKQREYFEYYYFENLSLGEIAENLNVSRNAAFKQINIVKEKLDFYEEKLKLNEKSNRLNKIAKKISDASIKEEIEGMF
ncbi:MAG: DNA-binding protein [Bacilli bacterium]|nr:DNA-binding protein [Bacilli bacterium]